MGAETDSRAYGQPMDMVMPFNYLGRILTMMDYYWKEVIVNLQKELRNWSCLSRILGCEGADDRMSGRLYLSIVQVILLFGTDTWVVNHCIGRLLGGFHHGVVWRIADKQPW